MVDITPVISAVLTLAVALVTTFLIPYLRAKLTAEQLDTIKVWVNIAVRAAEMIFTGTCIYRSDCHACTELLPTVAAGCPRALPGKNSWTRNAPVPPDNRNAAAHNRSMRACP